MTFTVLDIETTSLDRDHLVALSVLWQYGSRDGGAERLLERAALHAYTGRVAVVGWPLPEALTNPSSIAGNLWPDQIRQDIVTTDHDEGRVILSTLRRAEWLIRQGVSIVTFGGRNFDFQFLRHRLMALRLTGEYDPGHLYERWHDKLYLSDTVVDLASEYAAGTHDTIKLHNLALMCGYDPGPTTGKDFVDLWEAGQIPEAVAHNERHLYLIRALTTILCPRFQAPDDLGIDEDVPRLYLVPEQPQPDDERDLGLPPTGQTIDDLIDNVDEAIKADGEKE